MTGLETYLAEIKKQYHEDNQNGDIAAIANNTITQVEDFLTNHSMIQPGSNEHISMANESLKFDTAMSDTGISGLIDMIKSCGIPDSHVYQCAESVLTIMNRCIGSRPQSAWINHNKKVDRVNNNVADSMALTSLYPSDVVNMINDGSGSNEAFGIDIDKAVPDLKVAVTVAILNFHTRLVPRMLPTRTTTQPSVSYTKTHLEVFNMVDAETSGSKRRLIDLYEDPSFVRNELQKIVPLLSNETDPANPVLLADYQGSNDAPLGIILFDKKVNLLKMSLQANKYGHTRYNRTDLIAENVKMDKVYVSVGTVSGTPEIFEIQVPLSLGRLTRMVNAQDSAMRNANITFRAAIGKNTITAAGLANTVFASFGEQEKVVLEFNLKPTISLKYGDADCLGAVTARLRHDVDDDLLVSGATFATLVTGLYGYSLDARFSEENMRKTNIATFTHRQPFSYDIPIGRNYVHDYAIGQDNAEENAVHLTKIIGIGQDDVALKICIRTLEEVYDRIRTTGISSADDEYIGSQFVAGDKVRPTVFSGTLDFSALNVIRDSDRSGDIVQKAISYLTGATSKIIQESFIMQQLGNSNLTFRAVTSMEVIGNVIGVPHIHDHLNRESKQGGGEGIEYTLVLPNGVTIEFITSTFQYMRNQIVMWPIIKSNNESDLNFAHNWDYGTMVAHYSPAGESANNRLFANIRELPIVINPVGIVISINGMDVVNGISQNGTLRPTIEVDGNITVGGTVTTTTTATDSSSSSAAPSSSSSAAPSSSSSSGTP